MLAFLDFLALEVILILRFKIFVAFLRLVAGLRILLIVLVI